MYLKIIRISDITNDEYQETYNLLSAAERERVDKKKIAADKKCSLAAFFLLNKILYENYGIKQANIYRTENGKPYLRGSNIYFSISHSGEYVATAVSDSEIGIDIECVRKCPTDIKSRICTDSEKKYIGDDDVKILTVWTLKEAAVKMTGAGIKGMKDVELDFTGGKISVNLSGAAVTSYIENDLIISICQLNK